MPQTPHSVNNQAPPPAALSFLADWLHRGFYLLLAIALFSAAVISGLQHLWHLWFVIAGMFFLGLQWRSARILLWSLAAVMALTNGLITGGALNAAGDKAET